MPIFSNKRGFYHKVFSSKDDAINYINNVALKENEGMYFSVAKVEEITPKDDIEYLLSFLYTQDCVKTIRIFPNNWNAQKIIDFLLDRIKTENPFLDWEKEFADDAEQYGYHKEIDLNDPYIKM